MHIQTGIIYLMKLRRQQKIARHKIPNLRKPGLKFDNFAAEGPTFFNRISNTFKLLQQKNDININNSNNSRVQPYNQTYSAFHLIHKNTTNMRMKQLAKPKQYLSSSLQKISNKEHKNQYKSVQKQRRYLPSPMKHTVSLFNNEQNNQFQNSIIGSGLASLPLQKILAVREQQLKIIPKTISIQSEHSQHQYQQQHNHKQQQNNIVTIRNNNNNKNEKLDQQGFTSWLQKIIGNQGHLYQEYQKGLLCKVQLYKRRRSGSSTGGAANHQGVWKK